MIDCAMSSTDTYDKEQLFESLPSFMLVPWGYERSRMRCHFPGLLRFGITPNLLICKFTMIGSIGNLFSAIADTLEWITRQRGIEHVYHNIYKAGS